MFNYTSEIKTTCLLKEYVQPNLFKLFETQEGKSITYVGCLLLSVLGQNISPSSCSSDRFTRQDARNNLFLIQQKKAKMIIRFFIVVCHPLHSIKNKENIFGWKSMLTFLQVHLPCMQIKRQSVNRAQGPAEAAQSIFINLCTEAPYKANC